jgi:hypothetical protein
MNIIVHLAFNMKTFLIKIIITMLKLDQTRIVGFPNKNASIEEEARGS